ncbi:hypothetical protein V6N13_127946 [Hibiscus sabdariffa]
MQNMTIDLHPIVAYYVDVILNGIEVFKLSNSDGNLGGVNPELLVAPPPPSSSESSHSRGGRSKKGSLLITGVGCAVGLITLLSLLACAVIWRRRKGTNWPCWWMNQYEAKSTRTSLLPDELCCHFSLDEMKAATNNFNDDLIVGKELQEAADVEKSRTDPGSECSYPDIVFPVARDDFDEESLMDTELDSEVYSGIGILDSDTTGLTYPTINSSTSSYPFSGTTNNTKSTGN